MAKKKFTDNLEGLFGLEPVEENFQENNPLLSAGQEEKEVVAVVAEPKVKKQMPKPQKLNRRRSSKNFSTDLESFFQDALQDAFDEKMADEAPVVEVKEAPKVRRRQRRRPRPVMGLDSLIRRTDGISEKDLMNPSATKRVTFIYDREELERLKEIAKRENLYLKDLLGKVVSEWVSKYKDKE